MSSQRLPKMPSFASGWINLAIAFQLVMLIYYSAINTIRLYPLNNLEATGAQIPLTMISWGVFLILMVLLKTRQPIAMLVGMVGTYAWLAMQLLQWWPPYLFGLSGGRWYIEGGYDQTLKILPEIAGRVVVPDLQHNILQGLSLLVIIVTTIAYLETRQEVNRIG